MAFQFTFDPNRCTGCQACVVACWMENRAVQSTAWRQVLTSNAFRHPALPLLHLSLACHHCEAPACLLNCPADAYTRDPRTGTVTIHADRCMGCRYCTWACPHDAAKFNPAKGTVEKCTFCPGRLEEGLEPACVARCPVEALHLESRTEGRNQDIPGIPPSTTQPALHVVPLHRTGPPELGFAPSTKVMATFLKQLIAVPEPKITLAGEWTLVVFTTVAAVLVAWLTASLGGGPAVPLWLFLPAGGAAFALSAAHLGRPARAWRAILHLRRSWLSREILLMSLFLGLGGLHLLWPEVQRLGGLAAAVGFGALFAIDRIYRVALKTGPWNLHSAHVLLNGCYLTGILARLWPLAILAGLLKLGLYLHRTRYFLRKGRKPRQALGSLRVALGFLGPVLVAAWNPPLAGLAAVLGDLMDRCEYYTELMIPTPQGQIAADLRRRIG